MGDHRREVAGENGTEARPVTRTERGGHSTPQRPPGASIAVPTVPPTASSTGIPPPSRVPQPPPVPHRPVGSLRLEMPSETSNRSAPHLGATPPPFSSNPGGGGGGGGGVPPRELPLLPADGSPARGTAPRHEAAIGSPRLPSVPLRALRGSVPTRAPQPPDPRRRFAAVVAFLHRSDGSVPAGLNAQHRTAAFRGHQIAGANRNPVRPLRLHIALASLGLCSIIHPSRTAAAPQPPPSPPHARPVAAPRRSPAAAHPAQRQWRSAAALLPRRPRAARRGPRPLAEAAGCAPIGCPPPVAVATEDRARPGRPEA